ncbi:Hypothetical predicted protein [Lynx pardinus]|uniref:Uncharacterized protein n=1 Tax=Lynx pardinus TaxID=191816 RepID=A0A485NV41_LYNPA|nr:Hypothetical predicted protein [Lynx pardinus]
MWLFSPAPYFRRTAALPHSAPLREGLTEQWLNEHWSNVGCTQEHPLDPAAAGAPRLWPGASPSQKMFARQCSSSISGIMENPNTHLAPGFTLHDLVPAPANVAIFWGLLGPGGFNSLPNVLPAVEPLFPVWPENLKDATLFLGICPSHQSTARYGAVELQPSRSPCSQS